MASKQINIHMIRTGFKIPVINTDFYPTLLDLANIPLKPEQHKDGISLKPILEGQILR